MFSRHYQTAILTAKLLDIDVLDVVLHNYSIPVEKKDYLELKVAQLEKGIPLDYLLEEINILDLKLKITQDTLIPREETEFWVDKFKALVSTEKNLDLAVDLGTGTGVIGLSLAEVYSQVWLLDISHKALEVASENAKQNKIGNVQFLQTDGLDPKFMQRLSKFNPKQWHLIANLPYLPCSDKHLAEEFKVMYEPHLALYSGDDGLKLYREVLAQIESITNKPTITVWELDPRNIHEAQLLLKDLNYETTIWKDNNEVDRVLIGCLAEN
jgi:release factor glutamine methyltransferase